MTRRFEAVEKDPIIPCHGVAVHVAKIYEELTGRKSGACISSCSIVDSGAGKPPTVKTTIVLSDLWGCNEEVFEEIREFIENRYQVKLLIRCNSSMSCNSSREHLGEIIKRVIGRYVKTLVGHTENYGREFFLVGMWNGIIAIGEGEESRVSFPFVRGVVFVHTHPSGVCFPSHYDVLSFQDFFGEGGLVEMIASSRCVLVAYTDSLSEEDYWELQDIANCIKRVKKNRSDEYLKCINRLYRLKSIVVETRLL